MTDVDREERLAEFETASLLRAVDQIDRMRSHLDGDGYKPPELRDQLLRLHQCAMQIVNEGLDGKEARQEMFDLAFEIEDAIDDIDDALDQLRETIAALSGLAPDDDD